MLQRSKSSYLPSTVGWFVGGGIGAFVVVQVSSNTVWMVGGGVIGGHLVSIIIDKYLDPRVGKLVKIDEDE